MRNNACWPWLLVSAASFAALAAAPRPAAAQTGTISGRVVDAQSGRPLLDAQLSIPGSSLGTLSRPDGRYTIQNVPIGQATVRITLIGYQSLERVIAVANDQVATLDFSLNLDAINLEGLFVTGLGRETERRKLTTSVDVITSEEISRIPATTIGQILQGRVAGATVTAQSGQPGTGAFINFRGTSSVFGARTPVIYIDGVRVDNSHLTASGTGGEQSSALADLLTSDIERIEITKGGAASTLYGSDAATGVIQIFTKKGRPGAPRFTFRSEYGYDTPELKYMFDTRLAFPDLVASGETTPTFMKDNYWKTGFALNQSLSVSGGTDAVTYNVSGRVQNEDGVQPKNESTIFALRGGLRANPTDDVTIDFSGSFTRNQFQRLFNGWGIGSFLTSLEVGDALFLSGAPNLSDALDVFLTPDIDETVNRFIFSGGFNWSITPNWFVRLTSGLDYRSNHQRVFQPIGFTPDEEEGQLTRYDREFSSFSLDAASGYSWESSGGGIINDITVGVQGYRDDVSVFSSTGTTFALPGAPDFDQAANISSFEENQEVFTGGVYVDESLDLWERLTLNVGVRFDASTSFGDDVSVETYPKAGVSYLVSDEEFFPDFGGYVNTFKLRGAYGETGKPPPPFRKDASFTSISFRGESAPRFDNPGNAELRPERTSTLEAGFDASLYDNRVVLTFSYYDGTTTDALFFVPQQPVSGKGNQLRNIGEISNKGIELAYSVQVINRENFGWTVGGTYQTVDNEVTDMGGAADFDVEDQKRVGVGRAVGSWFLPTPIDTNGDGLLDGSERQYSGGQPTPTSSGSFSTTLRIGTRWTVSSTADFARGHQVMDWGSVFSTFNGIYRRAEIEGVPFPLRYDTSGTEIGEYGQNAARTAFLYDGDWFKWREVSVRYQMPDRVTNFLRSDRGVLYASGRNLWIWSKTAMVDPELSGISFGFLELGSESSITASPPHRFRFGVELIF